MTTYMHERGTDRLLEDMEKRQAITRALSARTLKTEDVIRARTLARIIERQLALKITQQIK